MRLTDKILGHSSIAHGFFGRKGGVSKGIYGSLNCGLGTQDDHAHVAQNRGIVGETLHLKSDQLLSLYQIHSETCLTVAQPWAAPDRPKADAMVTDVPGIGLGILTADCAPVLFYGEKADGSPVIGAAHAGWGGALKGVLEGTVAAMANLGAKKETLRAAVGPCIAQVSYEVSAIFKDPFIAQDAANEEFFVAGKRPGHFQFNLPAYAARRLRLAGVGQVAVAGVDTYGGEEDYFSFRRSTHRSEADYGRQLSVISII